MTDAMIIFKKDCRTKKLIMDNCDYVGVLSNGEESYVKIDKEGCYHYIIPFNNIEYLVSKKSEDNYSEGDF